MIYLFFTAAILACFCFAFHYFSLRHALRDASLQLQEIQKEIDQNQILFLPIPNKHLERLLHTLNEILEEVRRERQDYEKREKAFQQQIANISHDLRTPLTVILGYLKLMEHAKDPSAAAESLILTSEELTESLQIIEKKARAMEKLVSQFYDFSRLTSPDYLLSIQPLDVCRLLRESLLASHQLLDQNSLHIKSTLPDHPVMVQGDPEALERIFSNLFQNAGRYADTFLHIELQEHADKICLLFSNDTILLSPEDIPHLFDRFYVQDRARTCQGTGLGLPIAQSLAKSMKGTLTVTVLEDSFKHAADHSEPMSLCFMLMLPCGSSRS